MGRSKCAMYQLMCCVQASGDQCCIACGRHGGRFVACEFCSRRVHLDCLEPPISRSVLCSFLASNVSLAVF